MSIKTQWVLSAFISLFVLGYSSYEYFKAPKLNHDMMRYMAVVLSHEDFSHKEAHNKTYTLVQKSFPEQFETITGFNEKAIKYRSDADFFEESMPFFRVKPLYTLGVYIYWKLGFPLASSTFLFPIACFFALGLFIFSLFFFENISPITTGLTILLYCFLKPINAIASLSSPDMLSTFLLIISFVLILKQRHSAYYLIALAALARPENGLFGIALGLGHLLQGKGQFNALIWILIYLLIGLLLPILMGNAPSWFEMFQHTKSIQEYIIEFKVSLIHFIKSSSIPIYIVLGLVCFWKGNSQMRFVWMTIFSGLIVRTLLFPSFQGRFWVGPALFALICSIFMLHNLYINHALKPLIRLKHKAKGH